MTTNRRSIKPEGGVRPSHDFRKKSNGQKTKAKTKTKSKERTNNRPVIANKPVSAKKSEATKSNGNGSGLRPRRKGSAGWDKLRIIPLGGLNEIGKNLTAFEYQNDILLLDCGMSFPEDEMFGVDVVIPDFDYLDVNKKRIRGLIVTHGHEDHIGGIPYLLKRMNVPVYATALTLGLIDSKLQEHGIKADKHRIKSGQKLTIGKFRIEAIHTTHSVADSLCYAIHTPVGTVFHTGDFKVDFTPIDGESIDLQKLAAVGKNGVKLLMSDSTNAVRKGFTESEQHLSDIMSRIFRNAQGRIIVATFASNIHRVQTIINTAVAYGRKVALSGRSMEKVFSIAQELGYVSVPKNVIVPLDEISHVRDSKLVIVSTGSQGEPMSALSRMASGDHKNVKIKRGDTIVLSSSPIPGNETSVSDIVNRLLELNAEVVYSDIADIHVSGHACEQELKLMLTLIKPEYFMPVHGEYRHLHRHAQIAEELGIPKSKIFVADNGAVVELGKNGASITKERVPADPVFVDGLGVGDVSTMVLRDRKLLSEAGLIIAVASIDQVSGKVTTGPDILTRGFSEIEDNEALMRELREVASHKLYELEREGTLDRNAIKTALRNVIRNYVFKTTKRSPMILPILMDS